MDIKTLAQNLKDGKISIGEWESEMRLMIREQMNTAMILTKGGKNFVTQSDWGFVGSEVKKQYQFLDKFAQDIAADPAKWLNGRLDVRMGLYKSAGYAALETFARREAKNSGMVRERRVLGAADHCPGCLTQAALGWQPIGTLDPIGAEECTSNCRCHYEYE